MRAATRLGFSLRRNAESSASIGAILAPSPPFARAFCDRSLRRSAPRSTIWSALVIVILARPGALRPSQFARQLQPAAGRPSPRRRRSQRRGPTTANVSACRFELTFVAVRKTTDEYLCWGYAGCVEARAAAVDRLLDREPPDRNAARAPDRARRRRVRGHAGDHLARPSGARDPEDSRSSGPAALHHCGGHAARGSS